MKSTFSNFGAPSTKGGIGASSGGNTTYGRVVDIILDSDHDKYEAQGSALALGGVFYKSVKVNGKEDTDSDLLFAYQGTGNIKVVPLIGEVVEIHSVPSAKITPKQAPVRLVYTRIINNWNSPHHNAAPNTKSENWFKRLFGKGFKESADVNPLQPFAGDLLIEGRQGQSIRFTGSTHRENPWVTVSNIGKPLTVISNGQVETDNGFETIVEDINQDGASIYLASDHRLPLKQAVKRTKSYEEKPEEANAYTGAQIVLNSNRLFFNSREESVLISSAKSFGASAKTINFDAESFICYDAPKIYLGTRALKDSDSAKEPLLKGKTSVEWLEDLVNVIEGLGDFLVRDLAPEPYSGIAQLKAYGAMLKGKVVPLKARLDRLKSRKVYTE